MKAWLLPDEAATELQVTVVALYKMEKAGQFHPDHVKWNGKYLRIHRDAIYPPVANPAPAEPFCPANVIRAFGEIKGRIAEIEAELNGQDIFPAHVSPIRRRA